MKKIWMMAACLLVLLCACNYPKFAVFPTLMEVPSPQSPQAREIFPADREAGENEVAFYVKLGDKESERMELQRFSGAYYMVDTDYKALMQRWEITERYYVYIGSFFMDEAGNPTHWAGNGEVRFRKDEEQRLVAVFNTHSAYLSGQTTDQP